MQALLDLLDARTLFLFITLLLIGRAVVMAHTWTLYPSYQPTRDWALGATLVALGIFLVGLRELVPLWLSAFVGNLMVLTGLMFTGVGVLRAADAKPPIRLGWLVIGLAMSVHGWYTLVDVNFQLRSITTVSVMVLFDLVVAAYCLRLGPGRRAKTLKAIGIAMLISAAANLYRLYWVFLEPASWVLSNHPGNLASLLIYGFVVLITTGFYVLLTSQHLQEKLDAQARRDTLTGAYNRLALEELGEREVQRCLRYGDPLSFLLVDIDHFKRINDIHGHEIGDLTLRAVSQRAEQVIRPTDLWCRYGGEEFVALLPKTQLSEAALVAERLRKEIELMSINSSRTSLKVTVSVGVAEHDRTENLWSKTVARADEAMYQAKTDGRNRVALLGTL